MDAVCREIFGYKCFDMEPVYETVEEIPIIVRGKPFISKLYRRKGVCKYVCPSGKETLSYEATFHDCGSDGVSKAFTLLPAVMPTPEECAKGRRYIQEIMTQALISQGIW